MKSTGEVMGLDRTLKAALFKGLLASGMEIPQHGNIVATIADKDKKEATEILKQFARLGFNLVATEGTAQALEQENIKVTCVKKLKEGSPNIIDLLRAGQADLIVNTLTHGRRPFSDGFQIRRAAVELNIPCLTSLDTLQALLHVITEGSFKDRLQVKSLQEYISDLKPCGSDKNL